MLIHLRPFLRNKVLKILRLLAFGNLGSWPIIRSRGGNENLRSIKYKISDQRAHVPSMKFNAGFCRKQVMKISSPQFT